ncbi:hypothetical protein AMELA_G00261330 [Ameiurus melas]|uniref:CCHC-type domain-containing protein n=1 Tax=Ameiurus melas TaxID=219545 RepID=A0A7J5ZP99_AMEME|nr:hypothetical protein AMELA_G00261330 [Ameiurus melas]
MSDLLLGSKDPAVKHVLSFRRQVYMFLNNRERTLDVNFKVKHSGNSYTVYATTERLRCFGCGEVGHKRLSCPRRVVQPGETWPGRSSNSSSAETARRRKMCTYIAHLSKALYTVSHSPIHTHRAAMQGASLPSGATSGSVTCPRITQAGNRTANPTISGQPTLPTAPQPPRSMENKNPEQRGVMSHRDHSRKRFGGTVSHLLSTGQWLYLQN